MKMEESSTSMSSPATATTIKQGAKIWHKVIPGIAITVNLALENMLTASFRTEGDTRDPDEPAGTTQCDGNGEKVWRMIAFLFAACLGLLSMKWNFDSGGYQLSRIWYHRLLNPFLVFAWLFSISDYPLACWIRTDRALTLEEQKQVSLFRVFCIAVAQALALFEVFSPQPATVTRSYKSREEFLHSGHSETFRVGDPEIGSCKSEASNDKAKKDPKKVSHIKESPKKEKVKVAPSK